MIFPALSIGHGLLLYFSSVTSVIMLSAVSQSRTQTVALCEEFSCFLENIIPSLQCDIDTAVFLGFLKGLTQKYNTGCRAGLILGVTSFKFA